MFKMVAATIKGEVSRQLDQWPTLELIKNNNPAEVTILALIINKSNSILGKVFRLRDMDRSLRTFSKIKIGFDFLL
jgi:hypothetical protein